MKIEIVTDITIEPVTLQEVKDALKITGTGHDDELGRLITDARKYVEKAIDQSVLERELKVTSDIELDEWDMPFGPVIGDVTDSTDDDYNYVYEYSAGYDETPADIRRLIILIIKYWYDIDDIAQPLPEVVKNLICANTRNPML
jgi:hypothetical protein